LNYLNLFVETMLTRIFPLLITMTTHEIAHGYMALAMGDDTAKEAGRLTLNPLKHLDPAGTVCMILFKFGWAKAVPINIEKFKRKKLGMFLVSIAGVGTNIIIAVISMFIYLLIAGKNYGLSVFLSSLIIYNVYFAIFNLLPFPPLDGSKVVASLLPEDKIYKFLSYEKYFYIILIILIFTGSLDKLLVTIANGFINGVLNFMIRMI